MSAKLKTAIRLPEPIWPSRVPSVASSMMSMAALNAFHTCLFIRAFLKSVQHAETRIFFRNIALIFLEIRKGFLRQIALSCEKIYVISAY